MNQASPVYNILENQNISFKEYSFEPSVFPPEKDFWIKNHLNRCKNLFFRDNHGKNHFLAVFNFYDKLDIKKLQQITGRGSLTMASGWRLEKYLQLKPGKISVFGIINDNEKHVKIILDESLNNEKKLSFLANTESDLVAISFDNLKKFLDRSGHHYQVEKIIEE